MINILFVDDQLNILGGLRRMLRSYRREWNMNFVSGGLEALQWLDENPCDIVVSDMRMPLMDGSQLLTRVRDQHPATMRLVLSGQSEGPAILRAITCAHQFLAKPSTPDLIKSTISAAIELRSCLDNEDHQTQAMGVGSLPSDVRLHERLERAIRHSKDFEAALNIAISDPAVSAKALQVVNSSFLGPPSACEDPAAAVKLLGLDNLAAILAADVFVHASDEQRQLVNDHAQFTQQVAAQAFEIAKLFGLDHAAAVRARTAGQLHLIAQLFDGTEQFSPLSHIQQVSTSAFLLGIWGVPKATVKAITNCLNPGDGDATEMDAATSVHLARHLVRVRA